MERSFNYRAMFLALLIGLTYLLFPLGGEAAVRTEFGDALSAHTAFNAFLTREKARIALVKARTYHNGATAINNWADLGL